MELMSFFLGDPFFAGDLMVDELIRVPVLAILNSTEVAANTEINPVTIIALCFGMRMRSDFYAGL
jgi:hypothetical protein